MISIFISFLYFSHLVSSKFKLPKDKNSHYVIFAISLSLSVATNGLISMLLVSCGLLNVPVFLIQLGLFFSSVDLRNFKIIISEFFNKFYSDYVLIKKIYGVNFLRILFAILFLLFLVSIGPINQSDVVNYYVGYPFQYYLWNAHFVSGDLGQGLLGIGDFANIAFIQEKSIWLIRASQFIPLIPAYFLLCKRNIPKIIILIFISSPVFVQWLTVGKINFLGDACLAIIYLCWKNRPSIKYALLSVFAGLIAISIKISSLLIFLPILFDFLIYYKLNFRTIYLEIKSISKVNFLILLIISSTSILSIFYYRYFLTGNFFFPFFSSIFNKGDIQYHEWEMMLKNFDREGFYQLWIFIPKNASKLASVLGPATGILFLIKFCLYLREIFIKRNIYLNIAFLQLIFLFVFAQGRADYYFSPLFLLACSNESFQETTKLIQLFFKKTIFKNIFSALIVTQLCIFSLSSFYMLSLNLFSVFNYEVAMDKTAYGYYNSKIIKKFAIEPVLDLNIDPSRLFYDSKFVSNHKYWKCANYSKFSEMLDKQNFCFELLKVNTIITANGYLDNNKNFNCFPIEFRETPRNIFKSSTYDVDFCKKK